MEFRAFADGTDGEPFAVPDVDDIYMCFVFDNPFGALTQGTAWAPVIDDERVVHHWLLMKTDNPDYIPGTAFPCGGDTLLLQMLMGWAPGTPNFVMPDEAGLELPGADERFVLQIHYNNTAGYDDALDNSGVALCTTDEPREHTASTLWLGTANIDIPAGESITTSGICDTGLRASEPFKMLLNWPHMHELGDSIRTEVARGGISGPVETLVDIPQWNFENQIYYPHEPSIEVMPGDVLRTTCSYTNDTAQDVSYGGGTGDEMCFDFALVYPITAFDMENPIGPPEIGRYCVSGFF